MVSKIIKKIKNLVSLNKLFGKKVVHVEAPHLFGEELKKHLLRYKSKCYCICPSNFEYVNSFFGIKENKKEFSALLKKYFLSIKDKGINLQLHVHLSMFPEKLSFRKKEEMINSSYNFFMNELKIKPKEIVFGWYASDNDAEEIAKTLGLKVIKEHFHIYDWWLK